jgi:hypothetical protein
MSPLPHVTPILPLITHPPTSPKSTLRAARVPPRRVHRPGAPMHPDPRLTVDTPAMPAPARSRPRSRIAVEKAKGFLRETARPLGAGRIRSAALLCTKPSRPPDRGVPPADRRTRRAARAPSGDVADRRRPTRPEIAGVTLACPVRAMARHASASFGQSVKGGGRTALRTG